MRDSEGQIGAQMRHEVPANQLFLWYCIEDHARVLDGPHAKYDGAAGRHVDSALVRLDPSDASAVADEPVYMDVVDDHQTLLCVRSAEIEGSRFMRLCLRHSSCAEEKLNAVEFVERKCSRPRRP